MKQWGTLALLIAIALSGCADNAEPEPATVLPDVTWTGHVQTPAFNPIAGATITVSHAGTVFDDGTMTADFTTSEATTDANGDFALVLPPGSWAWTATHPAYASQNGTQNVTTPLDLTMAPLNVITPYQTAVPFEGYIECAAEYLIITPSCDTIITFAGGPALFRDDTIFEVGFDDDWATLVLDVQFDLADHPGVAGLRVSAYAADANAELFNYERFHQGVSDQSFSMRLDPGTDYGDEVPTPAGAGGMRFEFYPHGHGDDTVCTPDECFLGVGVTYRLEFNAVATTFYHEPAPEGWTLLA